MQTVHAQELRQKLTGTRDQLCLWRRSESVQLSVCNESLASLYFRLGHAVWDGSTASCISRYYRLIVPSAINYEHAAPDR